MLYPPPIYLGTCVIIAGYELYGIVVKNQSYGHFPAT